MKFERLGDKILQVRGIAFNPKDISETPLPDYVPVLKANNIKERGIDTSNLIYIHRSKVKPEQFIKKGDLLLAASSGSKDIVGKNIFFENDFDGSFGAFCKLVRPNEKINHKFLGVFFKTPIFKRHIRRLIQGALINNLKNEHINSLQIPTLSFDDQIQIANILSKAETLIEQRKQSITLLDEFLKSTLVEMFLNKDKIKNWDFTALKNTVEKNKHSLKAGPFGSSLKKDFYVKSGYKIYGQEQVIKDDLNYGDYYINEELYKKLESCKIKEGDVLISLVGTYGKISVVPKSFEAGIINPRLMKISFDKNKINTTFFKYFFKSDYLLHHLKRFSHGNTMDIINLGIVKELKIPVPPIALQTQFATIVTKTETLKEQYKNSLQELENLYGSLSQQAFKGELKLK